MYKSTSFVPRLQPPTLPREKIIILPSLENVGVPSFTLSWYTLSLNNCGFFMEAESASLDLYNPTMPNPLAW